MREDENRKDGANRLTLIEGFKRGLCYWSNLTHPILPRFDQVLELHRMIFADYLADGQAGKVKIKPNYITVGEGRFLNFSGPGQVASDYARLLEDSRDLLQKLPDTAASSTSVLQSAWIARLLFVAHFHARLIFIHPFRDGNGRIARLIAWEQIRRLFGPLAVASEPFSDWSNVIDLIDQKSGVTESQSCELYMQAMKVLVPSDMANLLPLMRYFNPVPGLDVKHPQLTPYSIKPTFDPGQVRKDGVPSGI
jgi:fido (protein-threonine AMPylation protein)